MVLPVLMLSATSLKLTLERSAFPPTLGMICAALPLLDGLVLSLHSLESEGQQGFESVVSQGLHRCDFLSTSQTSFPPGCCSLGFPSKSAFVSGVMMFVLITVDACNLKFGFWNELVSEGKVVSGVPFIAPK